MRKKIPIYYTPDNSKLTFIKKVEYCKGGQRALYKCQCGVEKEIFSGAVKAGKVISCGCYNRQKSKDAVKHGLLKHPLYRLWASVKARCTNPNEKCYKNYGGRGVRLCSEWLNNPERFINWCLNNGWRKGLQLDKDIKAKQMGAEPLLYSPVFCQFVTRKENNNSTRYNVLITHNGETRNIVQWAEHLGMVSNTLQNRIRRRNWSIERALTTPISKHT